MCNIAGYSGKKQAAPILMEMLEKQAPYDGDMCTGIATIHEGKLHYRKIVGDVATFIRETDVLQLPGTIGIAHTRPSYGAVAPHPSLNDNETIAIVTNGTTPITKHSPDWSAAADMLDAAGYDITPLSTDTKKAHPRLSRNGMFVGYGQLRAKLLDYFINQGHTLEEAMVLTCDHVFTDTILVMLHISQPDRIYVTRNTRPMNVVLEDGEMYMATTRYGLPEHLKNEPIMLPLQRACYVTREGITVTDAKMQKEPVSEMTPYTYAEGYKRFEALLTSEKAPMYFDELEFAADEMRDLWPGDHTCVQHARLVYDMLWQFDREGRLKREMRVQERTGGTRRRWYFQLDK